MSGDGLIPTAPPEPPPPPPPAGGGPYGTPPSYAWAPGGGRKNGTRMRVAIAVVVAGIIVGVAIALPLTLLTRSSSGSRPPSAATSTQALSIYRQALKLMRSASGFHYVAAVNGGGDQRTVGDAARGGGRQDITVASSYGAEQFTLLLAGGTVYFQGNVPAFRDQLGVDPAKAATLAGSWISVTNKDGPWSVLSPGITTSDQADETSLEPSSMSQVSVGGVKAVRLQGTVPPQNGAPGGTGRLDVSADSHQPLAYFASVSQSGVTVSSTVTFTAWGTAPSVSVPSGAVAWSTLGATAPPGGYGSGGAGPAVPSPSAAI